MPKNAAEFRAALRTAFLYNGVTFVLLVLAVCVVYYNHDLLRDNDYTGSSHIRLVLAFVNLTLLLCTGGVLFSEVYLARRDGAGVSHSVVSLVHCMGVSAAAAQCGIIGGIHVPTLVNRAHPR